MARVTGITLDKERRLFYRIQDAIDIETRLGGESLEEAITRRGFRRLVLFMWAGLRHDDERLTPDKVAKLMDKSGKNYVELWGEVSEALVNSGLLPKPDIEAAPGNAPEPAGPRQLPGISND